MSDSPTSLVWLVPALPLAGFLVNGALAFLRPRAKTAVWVIGVGVMLAAFGVAVAMAAALARAPEPQPVVFNYWDWMVVGTLRVSYALQVDPRSEEHTSEL